ncbi:MAG: hypothetical protein QN212_01120 [Armatimonadota bacterium]|nr:hypothetical protein [Armatimonadota bacterium]MDR7515937.1 hypothetical protein [Armatimonadota bacterium]MDR7582421.1 hypothetical protein [Armatimonadota bacterium]
MTAQDALVAFMAATRREGWWRPGDRFFVQVREYRAEGVLLRLFNLETGRTCDRLSPVQEG